MTHQLYSSPFSTTLFLNVGTRTLTYLPLRDIVMESSHKLYCLLRYVVITNSFFILCHLLSLTLHPYRLSPLLHINSHLFLVARQHFSPSALQSSYNPLHILPAQFLFFFPSSTFSSISIHCFPSSQRPTFTHFISLQTFLNFFILSPSLSPYLVSSLLMTHKVPSTQPP